MNDERRALILELRKSKEFIKQNWSDPIAEQYLIWLEKVEDRIKDFEIAREDIPNAIEEIHRICQNAIDGCDDEPATKTRKRTN